MIYVEKIDLNVYYIDLCNNEPSIIGHPRHSAWYTDCLGGVCSQQVVYSSMLGLAYSYGNNNYVAILGWSDVSEIIGGVCNNC